MIPLASLRPGSITVLIGVNGSGKSYRLRHLAEDALKHSEHVLAIAPSIHDRFRGLKHPRYSFFGGRLGRGAARLAIIRALQRVADGDLNVLKQVTGALDYTQFDPYIGLRLIQYSPSRQSAAMPLPSQEYEMLVSAVNRWKRTADMSGTVKLRLESHSFDEISLSSLAILTKYERALRTMNLALDVVLFRNEQSLPLRDACSGEIEFITSIAFIAALIKSETLILIDEPETSLHPTWQKQYTNTLLDLFHYYQPRIVISTHSPIIISGAEAMRRTEALSVFEMDRGRSYPFRHHGMSLEEMYDRLFHLVTPRNHYVSRRAVEIVNALSERLLPLEVALRDLRVLSDRSYDENQRAAIGSMIEMAKRVAAAAQGGRSRD